VGGGLPLAVGLGLADKMMKRPSLTCCFFGEGAVAEGEFHESMNLAALWELPLLFACENNLYAMGTALARSESVVDLVSKAASYGVTSASVDGMDVLAVEEAGRTAAESVRATRRPYFLELRTYRFRAHSMFDAELYRTREEVAEWKKRDPIENFERFLMEKGLLDESERRDIEARVEKEVAEAVAFAEAAALEPASALTRFVYSPKPEARS
jgi:TPP-dependent pyruvate/acetoin dehydrogenase alpha subunit